MNRWIKIAFSTAAAVYMTLICFNNLTDYGSNFELVSMVISMEDTFSVAHNGWRGSHSRVMHHVAYVAIILTEMAICLLLWTGSYQMLKQVKCEAPAFLKAKRFTTLGLAAGVLLWFLGFLAIAGEWFLMWQSDTWNAQPTAFSLAGVFLLLLLLHGQENDG